MTRLSDDAWRAKMEGKTFRQAEPLPLFEAPPPETKPNPLAERIADAMVDGYVQTGNPADAVRAGLRAIVEHVVSEAVSSPTFRNEARDAIDRAEKAGTITPEAADLGRLVVSTSPPAKGLDGMLAQHERDHAAALDVPPPAKPPEPPEPRPPTIAIVCSRGRGGGCRRVKLPNDEAADPWLRAHAGSALAARRWTPEEAARVDAAIRLLAATRREFTADDVWDNLPGFLVTKGLAGRLMAAANAGLIANTGKKAQARRGGAHDHAQTLSVWIGTGGAS